MRVLFLRELRKSLLANLSVLLVLASIYAVAGEESWQLETVVFFQVLFFPFVIALGFLVGERSFPSSFKERDLLLLSGLPIARYQLWLSIVSARLLATSVCLGLASGALALANLILFVSWPPTPGFTRVSYSSAVLFLISYFSGSVFSLLIRRTLVVYSLGLTATEIALFLLRTFVRCCVASPAAGIGLPRIEGFSRYWLFVLCSALALMALDSAYIFAQSELPSAKRRVKNLCVTTTPLLSWLAVLLALWFIPALTSTLSDWVPFAYQFLGLQIQPLSGRIVRMSFEPLGLVSADGRYLIVPEYLRLRPWLSRISIVEVRTGHITFSGDHAGLVSARWLPGDLLSLTTVKSWPWLSRGESRPTDLILRKINVSGLSVPPSQGEAEALPDGARRVAEVLENLPEETKEVDPAGLTSLSNLGRQEEALRRLLGKAKHLAYHCGGEWIWISDKGTAVVSQGGQLRTLWPPDRGR